MIQLLVDVNFGYGHRLVIERDRSAMAAVEAKEWDDRRVEIGRQAELARREKKRRRTESEIAQRSQVPLLEQQLGMPWLPHLHCNNVATLQRCT